MLTKEQKEYSCKELSMALAFILVMLMIILCNEVISWIVYGVSVAINIWLLINEYTEKPKYAVYRSTFFFIVLGPITILALLFQSLLWKRMVGK